MTQLSPSILAADFARLGDECRQVLNAGADMLHFDVMDGCFVPNISFGVPVLQSLHKALPEAFFDVHLMIRRPLDYVEAFVKAGAGCITFHLRARAIRAKPSTPSMRRAARQACPSSRAPRQARFCLTWTGWSWCW